jgi:hypothetical protein
MPHRSTRCAAVPVERARQTSFARSFPDLGSGRIDDPR